MKGPTPALPMATVGGSYDGALEYVLRQPTAAVDSYLASNVSADEPSADAAAAASSAAGAQGAPADDASQSMVGVFAHLKQLWLSDLALTAAPLATSDGAASGLASPPSSAAAVGQNSHVSGDGWPKLVDTALYKQLRDMQTFVRQPRQEEEAELPIHLEQFWSHVLHQYLETLQQQEKKEAGQHATDQAASPAPSSAAGTQRAQAIGMSPTAQAAGAAVPPAAMQPAAIAASSSTDLVDVNASAGAGAPSPPTAAAAREVVGSVADLPAQEQQEDDLAVQKAAAREAMAVLSEGSRLNGQQGGPDIVGKQGSRLPQMTQGAQPVTLAQDVLVFTVLFIGIIPCVASAPWQHLHEVLAGARTVGRLGQLLYLQQTANLAYLPLATLLLLAPSVITALAQQCKRAGLRGCRVLSFPDPALEQQFVRWSSSGKLPLDVAVHVGMAVVSACMSMRVSMAGQEGAAGGATNTWLLLRPWLALLGVTGPLIPLSLAILLGGERYAQCREAMLVAARLCFTAALLHMHVLGRCQLAGLCGPVMGVTLLTAACQQVRLSAFIKAQLLHVLLVWAGGCTGGRLLHGLQLLGFGLCLPALLLYSAEVDARKAFMSAMWLHTQGQAGAGRM